MVIAIAGITAAIGLFVSLFFRLLFGLIHRFFGVDLWDKLALRPLPPPRYPESTSTRKEPGLLGMLFDDLTSAPERERIYRKKPEMGDVEYDMDWGTNFSHTVNERDDHRYDDW